MWSSSLICWFGLLLVTITRNAEALTRKTEALDSSDSVLLQNDLGHSWQQIGQDNHFRSYSEICTGQQELVVKPSAPCGIVMMAWGTNYSKLGIKVAARTRRLPAFKGWCPLDEDLDHIPVSLYTDTPKEQFAPCEAQGVRVSEIDVRGEFELDAWNGLDGAENLNSMLGTWKMRWYHAQSILRSPYRMTLYLDVDAYPCSAHGVAKLFHTLVRKEAYFGSSLVLVKKCHMTGGNCSFPHPPNLDDDQADEWKRFTERNSGVLMVDQRAKPILEEWGKVIERMAGQVQGDQYALREALFKYRDEVPQHIFSDDQVCRYHNATLRDCGTEYSEGCYIHHAAFQASLKKYDMVA